MSVDLNEHWRKLYANSYLGAWDLYIGGRYREVTVTIARITYEEVVREGGQKEHKLLLHLRGTKRDLPAPMILSKPNGKTLQAMFGDLPSGWIGKQVTLYAKDKKTKEGPAKVLTIRSTRGSSQLKEELAAPPVARIEADEVSDGVSNSQSEDSTNGEDRS